MKTDPDKNLGYNKKLQPFAHQLRNTMTKAEAALWKYGLRASGIKGYQFRRERPVLNYIADFMCKELKLVIEVDGFTHQWEETFNKDNKKDEDLKNAGFTVLRFSDNEVLQNLPFVLKAIEVSVEEIEKKQAAQLEPTPTKPSTSVPETGTPPPAEDKTANSCSANFLSIVSS